MATSRTDVESQTIKLSKKSFDAFCSDIGGMFGVEMQCSRQKSGLETLEGLSERFKNLVAVNSVTAEGALEGTFQLIFDREGLFTLAGLITMPEQMSSILEKCAGPATIQRNVKSGTLKEAQQASDTIAEAGNMLIGAWDRVFRKGLDKHKHFKQTNVFIGNPWESPEEIGLADDEELLLVPFEMTVGPYPAFNCGVIFPRIIFDKTKAEEKIRAEAEAKVRAEAEEKAKAQAEEKAKSNTEERTKAEAELKVQAEADARAMIEAEEKAKDEAEEKAKTDTEEKIRAKAVSKVRAEAESEKKDKAEPEEKAATGNMDEAETEEKIEADTKEKAETEPEEAEKKANADTEEKDKVESEEKTRAEAETEEKTQVDTEEKVEADTEEKAATDDMNEAEIEEPVAGRIAESIQKMTHSPAVLPGESDHMSLAICARDVMQKDVLWGNGDDSVQQVLTKMQQTDTSYMMVGTDETLEGIVSKSDITGAVSIYLRPEFAKWRRPLDDATLNTRVKWIMTRTVHTIRPEASLAEMLEDMSLFGVRALPVMDDMDKVQGLVTPFDIFGALSNCNPDAHSTANTRQAPVLV